MGLVKRDVDFDGEAVVAECARPFAPEKIREAASAGRHGVIVEAQPRWRQYEEFAGPDWWTTRARASIGASRASAAPAGLRCFTSRLRRPTRDRARCAGNLGLGPGALRQRRAPTLSAPALALGRDAPVLGAFAHLFLNLSLPRTGRAGEGVWRRLPRRLPRRALRYRHVLRIAEAPVRGRDGLRLHPERACRGARSSTCFACCVQAAAAYRFETLRSWPTALAFARSLSIFERVIGSRFSVAAGTAGPAMRAVPSGTEITRVTYASDNQSPARVRREGY